MNTVAALLFTSVFNLNSLLGGTSQMLSQEQISLDQRQPVVAVNQVNKDNILLTLAYLSDRVDSKEDINIDELRKPTQAEIRLDPGQTFAYHDDVLDIYKDKVVATTQAHFNFADG